MHYTVYQTTNLINGKIYIGTHITDNIDDGYLGSGRIFRKAVKKYGPENFKRVTLFNFVTRSEMFEKERELVNEEFIARKDTYNVHLGGKGGWTPQEQLAGGLVIVKKKLGIHGYSKERKQEINSKGGVRARDLKRGIFAMSEEDRKKYQAKAIQQAQTEEANKKRYATLARIGHSQGPKNTQFGTMWITNGSINKKTAKDSEIPVGWYKGRTI